MNAAESTSRKDPMKSVVLLSGGLDSSVNFVKATQVTNVALALTFHYGQRAAAKEIESASNLCAHYQVPHKILDLSWIKDFGGSSLIDNKKDIPMGSEVSMDDISVSLKTAASVWVPNRNGIFLNIAAGFAEALKAEIVIPGFNKEEAQTFPDNSLAFLNVLSTSFSFSTANHVKAHCYTTELNKTEILKLALELKLPLKMIWPCYLDEERWCGNCESCQRFKRSLLNNNYLEPLKNYFKN